MDITSLGALSALDIPDSERASMEKAVERIFGFIEGMRSADVLRVIHGDDNESWELRPDTPVMQDDMTAQALRAQAYARHDGLIPVSALRSTR